MIDKDVLRARAREMRREPTEAERLLWGLLRGRRFSGLKFRRQQVMGGYIADFVCLDARLIVEVDGGQHADNTYDRDRDPWLNSEGFAVLRFWNVDVLKETEGVLDTLARALGR